MNIKYMHTNIIAKDWEKLADFYIKTLGCKKASSPRNLSGLELSKCTGVKNAELSGIHLTLPGFDDNAPTLEIFQYTENKHNYPPCSNREGFAHIAFSVDNLEKLVDKIINNGGSKVGEITELKSGHNTIKLIYMADIEGNIIELQTFKGENEMNKRDEFVELLKTQLDEWNKKIDKLEKKVQSTTSTMQDKYKSEMDSLKSKRDDVKIKLDKAKDCSGEAFEELKNGFKETSDILKKTFDNIWNKFKNN